MRYTKYFIKLELNFRCSQITFREVAFYYIILARGENAFDIYYGILQHLVNA